MTDKKKYYAALSLFFLGVGLLLLALFMVDYIPFKQKLLILSVVTMASMAILIVTKAWIWRALTGVLLIFVSIYFVSSQKDLEKITQNIEYEYVEYELLALKDQEAIPSTIGVYAVRAEHHQEVIDNFSQETEFINYENLELLAQALENNEITSFIINDNLIPTISIFPKLQGFDFVQEGRFSIKVESNNQANEIDLLKESYLIYVSGVDVEGNVLTRSQSKMNFILAVNPKTNSILTVSIPKDSYLRLGCADEKMDALKNSGFYGIKCSMQTLENYFNLKFNYYVRVNLSGLEPLINALDGVDVYSDSEYISANGLEIKRGYNRLNGAQALETIRKEAVQLSVINEENSEHRYLLEAIMNKMLNEANIYSLPQHVSLLKNVLDTNFSNRDLSKIISDQISNKHTWIVESMNLRGYGDQQILYTDQSESRQFIYWPGDGSKRDILEAIEKVMINNGE